MRMSRPVTLLVPFLLVTACSAAPTPAAPTAAPTPASAASQPAMTTAAAASTAAPQGGTAGLPPAHSECLIVDAATAARLLGGSAKHAATPDTSDATVTHLDRCNWSAGTRNLSYQLDRFATKGMAAQVVSGTKEALKDEEGATPFTLPGDSVAFTADVGGRTMARGAIAVDGDLGIDLVATGPDAASAKAILTSVADLVLARTR